MAIALNLRANQFWKMKAILLNAIKIFLKPNILLIYFSNFNSNLEY